MIQGEYMKLEDIKMAIEKDIDIDHTELDKEAIKTPQLHNKYMNILNDEKMLMFKYEDDFKKLRKYKWLYYTGKISQEELEHFEWKPFQLNILKQDIDKFMDSDEDLVKLKSRISYQKIKIDHLESTIKMIANRQWLIRQAIDWIKFTNGT